MSEDTKRIFFALSIPQTFYGKIILINQLDNNEDLIRWSVPQNYHITLKFIGAFPTHKINSLSQMVNQLDLLKLPKLKSTEWTVFPNLLNPNIWALQFSKDKLLSKIVQNINQICTQFNIPLVENDFNPHLTVGRTKPNRNARLLVETFLKTPSPEIVFCPYVIVMYESNLRPSGVVYKSIQEFSV